MNHEPPQGSHREGFDGHASPVDRQTRTPRAGEDEADDGAMSKRAVSAVVRLVVPAGAAKPSPPVGPALGQHGVNIMSFCKDFNAKTSEHKAETPVPVVIEIYGDKTFEWTMKTPPTSYFVARAAGVKTCSQRPGHATAGRINLKHAYEIAKVKASDKGLGNVSLMSLTKSVLGTARSMGVEVTDPRK